MDVLPFPLPQQIEARPEPASGVTVAYESPLVTVYHGRAEHVTPALPTESVDLIVTDPPYGQGWESNRRAESFGRIDGDGADALSREAIREVLAGCVRVVRQQRHLYVFGPADVLEGLKVSDVVGMVWDKVALGSGDVTSTWAPSWEPLAFTVSKHRHAGKAGLSTVPTRLRSGTVLRYPRPTGRKVRHPSEKPVPLLRELIESSSKQGEVVYDPYAGVLSTAVAAVLAGRRAIVVESDAEHVRRGVERIEKAEALVAQMRGL